MVCAVWWQGLEAVHRGMDRPGIPRGFPAATLPAAAESDQAAGLAAQERDLTAAGAERIFGEQVSSTAKRVKLAECVSLPFGRDLRGVCSQWGLSSVG